MGRITAIMCCVGPTHSEDEVFSSVHSYREDADEDDDC